MLDVDRFDALANRAIDGARHESLFGVRERALRRAVLAIHARRLGYMQEEEFFGVIAGCCRMARSDSGLCQGWIDRLKELESLAESRQRLAFIESIAGAIDKVFPARYT